MFFPIHPRETFKNILIIYLVNIYIFFILTYIECEDCAGIGASEK